MKTKITAFCLALMLGISMVSGIGASAEMMVTDGGLVTWSDSDANLPITVLLDGNPLTFDVPPQLIKGRTMVPLRVIFEALGATVYWTDATQTVTAVKGATIVEMTIGQYEMYCSGIKRVLDSAPCLIDGRTLVPARAVAESFGMLVDWDDATRTVTIDTPAEPVQEAPAEDVFEEAHRKFRDFILQDGEWDNEDLAYWTGYRAGEQSEIDLVMYYNAKGASLSCCIHSEGEDVALAIRFSDSQYPFYTMAYGNGSEIYTLTGIFKSANAPAEESENNFPAQDRDEAKELVNICFFAMDTFVQQIVGMNLAQCGIYYEPVQ